jgi:hypothetical protein
MSWVRVSAAFTKIFNLAANLAATSFAKMLSKLGLTAAVKMSKLGTTAAVSSTSLGVGAGMMTADDLLRDALVDRMNRGRVESSIENLGSRGL